jgi:uncharacterized protein (DUF1330 family)
MRTSSAVALATLAGLGLGAGGMYGLRAQPKPVVYQITMNKFTNLDAYAKEYAPTVSALIKAHGGVFEAVGPGTVLEGSPPGTGFAIIRWESLEQLKGLRESPEYKSAHEVGEKYAEFTSVAVNGVQQ